MTWHADRNMQHVTSKAKAKWTIPHQTCGSYGDDVGTQTRVSRWISWAALSSALLLSSSCLAVKVGTAWLCSWSSCCSLRRVKRSLSTSDLWDSRSAWRDSRRDALSLAWAMQQTHLGNYYDLWPEILTSLRRSGLWLFAAWVKHTESAPELLAPFKTIGLSVAQLDWRYFFKNQGLKYYLQEEAIFLEFSHI